MAVSVAAKKAPGEATRFQKGQAGNPKGRPKGSRNKTTLALEALLDGEGENLTRKAVEMALEGDTTALKLCMDRILPPRKDRPIVFEMPRLEKPADAVVAVSALFTAVSEGALTPTEATELGKLTDTFLTALKVQEFEKRLEAMEAALGSAQ